MDLSIGHHIPGYFCKKNMYLFVLEHVSTGRLSYRYDIYERQRNDETKDTAAPVLICWYV